MSTQFNFAHQAQKPKLTSCRDRVDWATAMDLVVVCYQLSKQIPQSEIYGRTSQIRRAAVSIPANIVEGHGRKSFGELLAALIDREWFPQRTGNASADRREAPIDQ